MSKLVFGRGSVLAAPGDDTSMAVAPPGVRSVYTLRKRHSCGSMSPVTSISTRSSGRAAAGKSPRASAQTTARPDGEPDSVATATWGPTPPRTTRCSIARPGSWAPYRGIYAELAPTGAEELAARADALGRAFVDQGITFALSGQEETTVPAGCGAAGDLRCGVGQARKRPHPASACPGAVPRRHLRRPGDPCATGGRPGVWSPHASTSIGRPPGLPRLTGCVSTSPVSTSSGTRRARSGCWRTTCVRRPGCPT